MKPIPFPKPSFEEKTKKSMKRTIRIYGLIAGSISAVLMVLAMYFSEEIGFDRGMLVGYSSMIISLSMIFFAIQSYKKSSGRQTLSFKESFKIGMWVTVISALCYTITWMFVYHFMMPDFWQKYIAYELDKMHKAGASAAEIQKYMSNASSMVDSYKNPVFVFFMTFLEPLPVGLLMTLIASFISMRKHKAAMQAAR